MGCCPRKPGGRIDDFGRSLLSAHNRLRAKHGSPPLKWSSDAASQAMEWAEHLAESGTLKRGKHDNMEQNLAYKSGGEFTGEEATEMWYQEIHDYNFDKPGYSNDSGHFTQLVWASTTHIGAAKVTAGNKSVVVANYIPPGNVTNKGEFEKNVKAATEIKN